MDGGTDAASYLDDDAAFNMDLDGFEAQMIPVLKEGFLAKKRAKGRIHKMQKRYFVLDNSRREITYAHSKSSGEKKVVPFYLIERVDRHGGRAGDTFEVRLREPVNDHESYVLQAENAMEAARWVEAFESCVAQPVTRGRQCSLAGGAGPPMPLSRSPAPSWDAGEPLDEAAEDADLAMAASSSSSPRSSAPGANKRPAPLGCPCVVS